MIDKDLLDLSFETQCVHAGYKAGPGQPQVPGIFQNTTYRYYNAEDVAKLFDLESGNYMYSRLGNPTVTFLEDKMAMLEGGTAAVAAASGMAAVFMAVCNICQAGDHILSASNIYGGTFNLFNVTLRRFGIEVTFVNQDSSLEELQAQVMPNTKLIFAETLGNPALSVLDFEKFAALSKSEGIPLMVDNTLATPALCKPLTLGANIVINSTTKFADGHASCMGGVVVEGGNFNWASSNKFPTLTGPDESYHGLNFYQKFGNTAFSTRLRAVMLRDFGSTMSPMNAYLTCQGLQTLHVRMEKHSDNASSLARLLKVHPQVEWVSYPGLPATTYYDLGKKYLPDGCGGVLSFGVKGGRAAGEALLANLKLASQVVHVGDIRTSVLHPASTTHRQLTDEQQLAAGIRPELIRVSVGLESKKDILADFDQALKKGAQ